MRRMYSWLLALALLLTAVAVPAAAEIPAGLTVVRCPEADVGFSTLVDSGFITQWVAGDGLYVYTRSQDSIPYVLVTAVTGHVDDYRAFIHDKLTPMIEKERGSALKMISEHEYLLIGGKKLPAVTYVYDIDSGRITMVRAYDEQDGRVVAYTAKYIREEDKQLTLDALDTVAENLRLDPDYYGAQAPAPEATPGTAAGIAAVTCQEQDFSAICPAECTTLFEEGNGLYVFLGEHAEIPYVLIFKRAGSTDILPFLKEELEPALKQRYGDDLLSAEDYDDITVGGRQMHGRAWRYRVDDRVVSMLRVMENRDGYCTSFVAKYYEDDPASGNLVASALNTLVASFQPDAHYYDNARVIRDGESEPQPTEAAPEPQPLPPEVGQGQVYTAALTDLRENVNAFGRCVAPEGAVVNWKWECCTERDSYSNPCRVAVSAGVEEKGITMVYLSEMDYVSKQDGTTQDNTYNSAMHTPMLHYMTAAEYCDYYATTYDPSVIKDLTLVEEDNYPGLKELFTRVENNELQKVARDTLGLMTADKAQCTMCTRRYAFEHDGISYYFVVMTGSVGVWLTMHGYVAESYIGWTTPFTYSMICPVEHWDAGNAAFRGFVGNTTVSDQFKQANEKMSNKLWEIVAGKSSLSEGRSFSEKRMREATASGEDYSEERMSDYIFDQNDYTLSDGSHVKVSTAYDYVYEGDNGVVYYSDSAFTQPGGSTQLTPNR